MTMLLGYNLGDIGYITADTRGTLSNGIYEDKFQKIEILNKQNLIIAVAGNAFIGSVLIDAIADNTISLTTKNIKDLADCNIEKVLKTKQQMPPSNFDTILLIESIKNDETIMETYYIKCSIKFSTKVTVQKVNKNELIKVGSIGASSPIRKESISRELSEKVTTKSSARFEDYLGVTDELFNTAESLGIMTIGGKTITLKFYKDSNGKLKIIPIRGYRSVIHEKSQFQDVSYYTDLNLKTGGFYLRDMRSEGKIVTHLQEKNGKYMFRYDSCSTSIGEEDFYYKRLAKIADYKKLELELKIK